MDLDIPSLYAVSALGILLALATVYMAFTRPRASVTIAFLLVLVAGTRVRTRDPAAILAGEIDSQVLIELGLYGLMGLIGAALLVKRRLVPTLAPVELLLAMYVILSLASFSWSQAPNVTLVRAIQLIALYCLAIGSVRIVGTSATVHALTGVCTLYVLGCSVLTLLVRGWEGATDDMNRFHWFAVHPITAGSFSALAALFVLAKGLYSARGWRARVLGCPAWLYPAPLVLVLVLTNSRGPLLAFAGGVGILLLKRLRARNATVVMSFGLLLILLTVLSADSIHSTLVGLQATDNFLVRRLFRDQTADQVMGLSGRAELWGNASVYVYESPLVGHGYQGSRRLLLNTADWAGGAHNGLVQTLLDVGIVGTACLLPTFIFVILDALPGRISRRAMRWEDSAAHAGMVFLLLNSITHESFAAPGYEALVLFTCVSLVARSKLLARAAVIASLPVRRLVIPSTVSRRLVGSDGRSVANSIRHEDSAYTQFLSAGGRRRSGPRR